MRWLADCWRSALFSSSRAVVQSVQYRAGTAQSCEKATGSPIRNCIARPTSHIRHDWRAHAFAFTAFVVSSYGNFNITNDEEV